MIQIDYRSQKAIYEQVRDELKKLIMKGILKEDEQIPSVREIAGQLAINPNTIQRAYRELENEGFIYSVKGRGNFVSPRENAEQNERIHELLSHFKNCASELLYLGVTKEELTEILQKGENSCD
ncbi:MAG: GntR family transcriptional regulator [Ruminococcaceae bacterium]|nr:GntR family transcriptional regulator [Oscillospiraceae bacterium]